MDDDEVENNEKEEEEEDSEEEENSTPSDGSEDDEGDEVAEIDAEMRQKVADVLRASGAASDSEDDGGSSHDSHDEDIHLDDEQMMDLDAKLAELFKSRGVGKSKAGM
jgi:DNA polymerase phi